MGCFIATLSLLTIFASTAEAQRVAPAVLDPEIAPGPPPPRTVRINTHASEYRPRTNVTLIAEGGGIFAVSYLVPALVGVASGDAFWAVPVAAPAYRGIQLLLGTSRNTGAYGDLLTTLDSFAAVLLFCDTIAQAYGIGAMIVGAATRVPPTRFEANAAPLRRVLPWRLMAGAQGAPLGVTVAMILW